MWQCRCVGFGYIQYTMYTCFELRHGASSLLFRFHMLRGMQENSLNEYCFPRLMCLHWVFPFGRDWDSSQAQTCRIFRWVAGRTPVYTNHSTVIQFQFLPFLLGYSLYQMLTLIYRRNRMTIWYNFQHGF